MFLPWLAVVSLVGVGVRLIAVARASRTLGFNDGLVFHAQANFLAAGSGFVDAGRLGYTFVARPSAQHPPLFPLVIAAVSKLGGHSVLAHQLTCVAVSSVAVPLIGLTAREVGGSRAGLAAAGIAAVYPNLWASDVGVMSESLYVTTIALVLLTSCRLWRHPSVRRAALVGVAIGIAALAREEAILLLPLALVPQCLHQRCLPTRRRLVLIGTAVLAATLVTAPWVIRNLTTFDRPVFLADNVDSVIAGANCHTSYYGPGIGSWSSNCNAANLPVRCPRRRLAP
jgi:4-amino-4-deoxy-L-arabinose transferase-like glycosyltransferase